MKRKQLAPVRAEDLVFVHNNLRLMSRRTESYKTGANRIWDVGGDGFESFSGVGILEVASLSLDEPEMEAISFEEQVQDGNAEEGEDIAVEEA